MSGPPRSSVRASVRLSLITTLFTGAFQFVLMVVLARLIPPQEYGIYALALAISALTAIFVANVAERLLVVQVNDNEFRDPTLTISVGCFLAAAAALAACGTLNAVGAMKVDLGVLAVTLFAGVLSSAAITSRVELRREIRFKPIVFSEACALVLGGGVGTVLLALSGLGAYALALGSCIQVLLIVSLLRRARPTRLTAPSFAQAGQLIRSGKLLGGSAAIDIINGQIAPLMVGSQVGASALGLFNRTYALVQMPIQLLVSSMSRVMLSALFAIGDDPPRLRSAMRSLVMLSCVVVAPVAAGIAGANNSFVLAMLGAQWAPAAEILPLLAASAWAMMMGTLFAVLAESRRAFAAKLKLQLICTTTLAVLSFFGAVFGLKEAVLGIAISSAAYLGMFACFGARLLSIRTIAVFGWMLPGVILAAPCFVAARLIGSTLHGSPWSLLMLQIASCGGVAALTALAVFPGIVLELLLGAVPSLLKLFPWLETYLRKAHTPRNAEGPRG